MEFNHAMIYTRDVAKSLAFYRDLFGFTLIEEYPGGYARLQSPSGETTIGLHLLDPGMKMDTATEGMRLYFEIKTLEKFCTSLKEKGVKFKQEPKIMPWGWKHAYLHDPDGHEISLYWAGAARFKKTRMK